MSGRGSKSKAWLTMCGQALFFAWAFAHAWSAVAATAPGASPSLPEVRFEAQVTAGADHLPRQVRGLMHIRNWRPKNGYCVYLAYEDPDYGEDRGTTRRFEMLSAKAAKLVFEGGALALKVTPPVSPQLAELRQVVPLTVPPGWSPGDELTLAFDATVPRLQSSDRDQWFYDGFMPELLDGCPAAGLDPVYYRRPVAASMTGRVTFPQGWDYIGPGTVAPDGSAQVNLSARGVAFTLGKSFKRVDFKAGDVPVSLVYHSKQMLELQSTIEMLLPAMTQMFGPYPYDHLTVLETSELQRHGLPGLVAMNEPAQAIFSRVQKSWLNWQHWILALQLARQWYGGAVTAATPDDDWLIQGIAEFVTLEALARHPERFNLFTASDTGIRWLSFDYLQISEITAATLHRYAPFAVLTTPELVTRDPVTEQHPLLFVKHAFAMRQLMSYAGEGPFFGFLRNLTAHHQNSFLSPRDFAAYLGRLPSPFAPAARQDLAAFLARWWVDEGWPDFTLENYTSQELPNGRWLSNVEASQEGGIDFPPLLGVRDESGHLYAARGEKGKGEGDGAWHASIVTPYKPVESTVDPTHEAFDSNRFDNSSRWPGLTFFPGNADTLRDDAYTVIWLPYAFRRPGEPFSLGVQGALFRYMQSGLIARIETAPSEKKTAYDLRSTYQIPRYALSGELAATRSYDNDQLQEVALTRSPLINAGPNLSLQVRARHKQRIGQPESSHDTGVIGARLRPNGVMRTCTYDLGLSLEEAPAALAHGFSYERKIGTALGECNLSQRVSLGVRLFRGAVTGEGDLPDVALFKPTELREAHLRLDRPSLGWSRQIATAGVDLLLPFYLPLPSDTMILARQMRWRLFYDFGRALDQDVTYRSSGVGFILPLGGDLSGAGSLALSRLAVLAILYSNIGGGVSRRPSVVFDLTGDL